MQTSVILTIGSRLTRAEQDDVEVAVLVQGEWFRGRVLGVDGHGLVLDDGQGHDLVVRLEHVAVLEIEQEQDEEQDSWADEGPDLDIPRPRAVEASELTV